jgi:hypothetical protein
MYYRVQNPCTFAGVAYQPGDVIDLADAELAARLLREVGGAVMLTNDPAPLPVVKAKPLVVVVEEEALDADPQPEAAKSKRSHK